MVKQMIFHKILRTYNKLCARDRDLETDLLRLHQQMAAAIELNDEEKKKELDRKYDRLYRQRVWANRKLDLIDKTLDKVIPNT